MKVVLFCRVSSREQEETGYSLPAQEKYLRDYTARNKLEVEKVFAISESASGRVQRKTFNEMIAYIRNNKIPIVVVETTDRLTRNFADVPTIDKWILDNETNQIHLAKEGCILDKNSKSHEWFMWRVKVATAEYYVRLLSENVKKGQKEKIAQGWMPTKPPVGYKTIGDKGHKVHVIDEAKAPLIKKMFALYATRNYSLKQLTETMYKEGLRNDNGNKIVKSRIHRLLLDTFYIGKFLWNDEEHAGNHEALIDEDTFYKVKEILTRKGTPKYRKHNYLLQGMFHCGECKGTITWEVQKGIIYGHCNGYKPCSQKVWYKQQAVETLLSKELSKLKITNPRLVEWIRKALKEGHKDKIEYHSASLQELQAKQEQLNKRLDKMYEDKLDEKITQKFYDEHAAKYKAELKEILKSLEKHTDANNKYHELGLHLYELSQRATAIYEKATRDDKRLLINLVFSDLHLKNDKITATYSRAFQILSELVKLTNRSKVKKTKRVTARIFEPKKKVDFTIQTGDFYSPRPIWLPSPRVSIQAKIKAEKHNISAQKDPYESVMQAFQDIRYMGELIRLTQISQNQG